MTGRRCIRRGTAIFVKPEHFAERYLPRWGWNLRDYPHSIRFLKKTHLRWIQKLVLENKFLPANSSPIWASIFNSSCYGFTNIAVPRRMQRLGIGSLILLYAMNLEELFW